MGTINQIGLRRRAMFFKQEVVGGYVFDVNNLVPFPEAYTGNSMILVSSSIISEAVSPDVNGGSNAIQFFSCCNNGDLKWDIPSSNVNGSSYQVKFWVKNIDATDLKYQVMDIGENTTFTPITSYYSSVNTGSWTQISFVTTNNVCCAGGMRIWFSYKMIGGDADVLFWGFEVYQL